MYRLSSELTSTRINEIKRKEIAGRLKHIVTPDDVIAAILLEIEEIPLDARKIHTAIAELKQEYPEILGAFVFSRNDLYPFSRLLEKVLFRLQNSTLIKVIGPDFRVGIVPEDSKIYIRQKVLPLFSSKDKPKLQKMAREFQKLMIY